MLSSAYDSMMKLSNNIIMVKGQQLRAHWFNAHAQAAIAFRVWLINNTSGIIMVKLDHRSAATCMHAIMIHVI